MDKDNVACGRRLSSTTRRGGASSKPRRAECYKHFNKHNNGHVRDRPKVAIRQVQLDQAAKYVEFRTHGWGRLLEECGVTRPERFKARSTSSNGIEGGKLIS